MINGETTRSETYYTWYAQPTLTSDSCETQCFETVIVNRRGKIISRETKTANYYTEDLNDGISLEMSAIPGGKFLMGANYHENGCSWEKPQHEVTIQPFFMGKYPITQAQWREIASRTDLGMRDLKTDPSKFRGDNRPVEQVSWYDAVEFCARLSKLTGREYLLPSEAQWEYACRAGTSTAFYFGETITSKLANYNAQYTYADEQSGQYRRETTPVGQFPPNAFGLYDMHGNVSEWCADIWHDNYSYAPSDGSVWLRSDYARRVTRGSSLRSNPYKCRSADRDCVLPYAIEPDMGFRVVCIS